MREHLSHQERTEQLEALRLRYHSKEIGLRELQGALDGLGLSATEKQELLREVTDAHASRPVVDRHRVQRNCFSHHGVQLSPADKAAYDTSVEWLAAYKKAKDK